MTDIALQWDTDHADVAMGAADLVADEGLETAVILSLFLDRRADADDGVPLDQDPRGWWGDTFASVAGDQVGSKLWLLGREKQLAQVAKRAQTYATEALAWLVEEGVASEIDVQATFVAAGRLTLAIAIQRPQAPPFNRQYQYVWSAL
ncbi:phage GP46 family protein [Frateuria sp. YIM B11624]|uniref:phage GP46 family protein n=1 Tax=Frateuria sp. YIM B11624 TaxID=3143185 RepID=UPI003C7589E1